MFRIGDKLTKENYTDGAIWCNYNNCTINTDYVIVEIPTPVLTYEEVSARREVLYREKVDPLTSQIQRLRDEEQTEEVIAEIEKLIEKRNKIVATIKEENPYPTENEE